MEDYELPADRIARWKRLLDCRPEPLSPRRPEVRSRLPGGIVPPSPVVA